MPLYCNRHINAIVKGLDSDANHLYHTNAVTINGTLYKPGKNTLLHFANTGEGLPELGRLVNIWQVLDLGPVSRKSR